jgi:hypothetical protein
MGSGANQSALLATVDRRDAAAEVAAAAQTDFDEYELIAVRHHEIDFAASCPIISRNETQAPANKESLGNALGATAESCRARFWFRAPQSAERPTHHGSRLPMQDA